MAQDGTESLKCAVLAASVADTWDEARAEWSISGYWESSDTGAVCVCGHEGLRHCYEIRNRINGNRLSPVGSDCIRLFDSRAMNGRLAMEPELTQLLDEAVRLGKGQTVSIGSGLLTQRLVRQMAAQSVFDIVDGDRTPEQNVRFLLHVLKNGAQSQWQQEHAQWLVENAVYPFLRRVWVERNS